MQEENTDPKSDLNVWFGLLIIGLFLAFYHYHFPDHKDRNDLASIDGKLLYTPEYINGGESSDYIKVRLIGDKRKYLIRNCGFWIVDREKLFRLRPRDRVKLFVDKEGLDATYASGSRSLKVYEFQLTSLKALFTLEQVNDCEKVAWERILKLVSFTLIPILYGLIKLIKARRRTK